MEFIPNNQYINQITMGSSPIRTGKFGDQVAFADAAQMLQVQLRDTKKSLLFGRAKIWVSMTYVYIYI